MSTLLSGSIQPPLLTLFSSTSIPPLTLFQTITGSSSKSLVTVVDEANLRASSSSDTGDLIGAPERGILLHPVLHLQSPIAQDTYIQAGVSRHALSQARIKGKGRLLDGQPFPLGIELPWVGMQIRPLGKRPMSFELGVVDTRGREGVIRVSSFKTDPSIHPYRDPPILHLPLTTPTASSSTLTPWLELNFNVATILPMFTTTKYEEDESDRPNTVDSDDSDDRDVQPRKKVKRRRTMAELPNSQFGSITYVRVYANCRLRRIWFSEQGQATLDHLGQAGQQEWALYAARRPDGDEK